MKTRLEELTVEQLVTELTKRPLHFVLAWWETTNNNGDVVSNLPDDDVIGTLENAIDYVCYRSDSWDE